MTATVPPLFGPEMLADPYATYAQLRGPASWNEQMGLWLLTRYEDVRWALGDPRLSSTMAPPSDDSAHGSTGNGAAMLLDLSEIRKELEQDPSRWPAAVEELMRLVSPNQFIRRRVREDVVLGEQTMRAGDTVLLIIAARKPRSGSVPDPDRFVLNRPQTVALGHGIHYCLGAPLARLEGRIALQTVFERWPTIRQAGELEYADNFNVRILRSLPVATS